MRTRGAVVVLCLFAGAVWVGAASGAAIPIPCGSFETPVINTTDPGAADYNPFGASPYFSGLDWQKGGPIDPGSNNHFNDTGIFKNTDPGQPDHIVNADGVQLAFIGSVAGDEVYQEVTANYTPGQMYLLTLAVGVSQRFAPSSAATFDLRLYYRDPTILTGDNRVTVGAYTVTNDVATALSSTALQDFTLPVPTVTAGEAWAGKAIGVQLIATGTAGGFWDVDNVRLAAIAAPEPTSLALLALGALGLARRRRKA